VLRRQRLHQQSGAGHRGRGPAHAQQDQAADDQQRVMTEGGCTTGGNEQSRQAAQRRAPGTVAVGQPAHDRREGEHAGDMQADRQPDEPDRPRLSCAGR